MSSRDLLEVADGLLAGPKVAHRRFAVSRAYYAAFHEVRRLLRGCGFVVPKGEQAHAYLWLRLSNCGHPDLAHDVLREVTWRAWRKPKPPPSRAG